VVFLDFTIFDELLASNKSLVAKISALDRPENLNFSEAQSPNIIHNVQHAHDALDKIKATAQFKSGLPLTFPTTLDRSLFI